MLQGLLGLDVLTATKESCFYQQLINISKSQTFSYHGASLLLHGYTVCFCNAIKKGRMDSFTFPIGLGELNKVPKLNVRVCVCVSHLVSVDGVLLLQLALSQRLIFLLKLLQLFGWDLKTPEKLLALLFCVWKRHLPSIVPLEWAVFHLKSIRGICDKSNVLGFKTTISEAIPSSS